MMLDTIALWTAGITFTVMTGVCGFAIRLDEAFVRPRIDRVASRTVLIGLGCLALLTLTAAVL